MVEFFKHLFGVCGDGHAHPNIWMLLGLGGTYLYIIKHKVKWCWKRGCKFCQNAYKKARILP
jgi:hypothetical protein